MKKNVTFIEKLGLMLFSMGGNVVFSFRSGYYLMFLTNILQIPIALAGTITTIGLIWDAVNDPLIGVAASNIKFKSGEIARPWLLISSVPWAVTTVLLFCNFGLSQTWTSIVCILIYVVYEIASTIRGIPYSLTANLSSYDDEERKSMNAFKSLGAALGSGIGAVAVLPIIRLFGGLNRGDKVLAPLDSGAVLKTAIFMGILCIVGCLIHYFTSKERVRQIHEENHDNVSLLDSYKILFKVRTWKLNLIFLLCYNASTTLLTGIVGYFTGYVLKNQSYSTSISAVYLLAMLLFSALTPIVDRRLGRRRTLVLSIIVQIVGKIPFIIKPDSLIFAYLNAFTLGVGATTMFVLMGVISGKINDIVEIREGRRLDAMVSGSSNIIVKLGSAGMTVLITAFLSTSGFDASLGVSGQPVGVIRSICLLMGLVPIIFHGASLVTAFFIDADKEYKEVSSEV